MSETAKADILIVDDTRANLRFLAEILTSQGYLVRPALDGQTALASSLARPPDLILLDIMMPQMDGYAVCAALKANALTKDIPVIFLSALNEVLDKVKAFEMGGVDYITKPFQVEEVLVRVETHLTLRFLQQQLEQKNAQLCGINVELKAEIAERERTQLALEQHAAELESSNAELDAFAHTVAHDLKTPLTALIGFGSLLVRRFDQLPVEKIYNRLQLMLQTGHKMTTIINELLLLARVRQVEEVDVGRLDMTEIVREVLARFNYQIQAANAEIIVAETWPEVSGYAPWVEEVWANYISNALKYGGDPAAGIAPQITLGYQLPEASSQVCFWVRDNGPGLTDTEKDTLFTPFTRLREIRVEGHGLGLSIVRRIVAKLGGDVGVDRSTTEGCKFWFSLELFSKPDSL